MLASRIELMHVPAQRVIVRWSLLGLMSCLRSNVLVSGDRFPQPRHFYGARQSHIALVLHAHSPRT